MPSPHSDKPHHRHQANPSFAVRVNRAASDLNPFLVLVAVGLLLLNLTFYLGMSVSPYRGANVALPASSGTAESAAIAGRK